MQTLIRILLSAALVLTVAGCAHQGAKSGAPEILGRSTANGKGIPNGRSDSDEDYAPLKGVSDDDSYGYTKENPIRVGVGDMRMGSASEKYFLNALLSAGGKPIEYERAGSCCTFSTPNGFQGAGLLDVFIIKSPDSPEPITLYINMYDPVVAIAPKGFTIRPPQ
jgi:hypothetical protein